MPKEKSSAHQWDTQYESGAEVESIHLHSHDEVSSKSR